jgi:hypothetical protein
MKLDRRYLNLTIVGIAIAVAWNSMARAQNGSAIASASASTVSAITIDPSAVSDQRNWQSFQKLAVKPNAIVTVRDLENAFGQKATHQEKAGFYNFYSIRNIVMLDSNGDQLARARYPSRASNFVFFHFFDSRNAETCITRDQAISELQKAGWVLRIHTLPAPIQGDIREVMPPDMGYATYTFTKGDEGVAILGYLEKTNCAGKLTMEADKLEFDRVTHSNLSGDDQ